MRGSRELVKNLPPRGESTEPMETSPEPSDGEERDEIEFEDEILDAAGRLETAGSDNVSTERERERSDVRAESAVGASVAGGGGEKEKGEGAGEGEGGGDEEGEWIDEEDDTDDDLLHLEYHPSYVLNSEKRRKRWDAKWDALVKAVRLSRATLRTGRF